MSECSGVQGPCQVGSAEHLRVFQLLLTRLLSLWFYSAPIQICNDFLKYTSQILLISCFCLSWSCPAGNLLYVPSLKLYRKRNPHGRFIPSLACSGEWSHNINSAMSSLSEMQIQPELLPQLLALAQRAPASNAVVLLGLLNDKSSQKYAES